MKKYNHLYFTEESREMVNLKNCNFWIHLSDLERVHPDIKIITTESLEDKWGYIYPVLHFECEDSEILKKVQKIYNDSWYPFPLKLYPEFSHLKIEDIIEK